MIVSKNWLADYVTVGAGTAEITDRLTMSGLNLEGVEPAGDDEAIDLEVTSNRPDCLGHLGVAREMSVLFDVPLNIPEARPQESDSAAADLVGVTVQADDLCHEYHARVIRGVKVGASPDWLKARLEAIGLNSVNNVVDVTNYVMMECGQPLHAFDLSKVGDRQVIVRRAAKGESLVAIDQKKYELTEEMCVIADAQRPMAIAGVMGGLDSEISDATTDVLIETASFSSLSVRATARALKLFSPSSYRFERKVDRRNLDWASRRCCELILQVAGGELASGVVADGASLTEDEAPVALRFDQVPRLLGMEITADECVSILERLGLKVVERTAESVSVVPPGWRPDLTRECDLIEEVARIHGYDNIPDDAALPVVGTQPTERERVTDAVRDYMTGCGLFESLTLSFVSDDVSRMFRPEPDRDVVAVRHSSRSHENLLRQNLIPSLLVCRRQNERHGTMNAELFEIARVYLEAGTGAPEEKAEPLMLGLVSGRPFAGVRGLLEGLVATLAPSAVLEVQPKDLPEFIPGHGGVVLLNGRAAGWIGELDRSVTDAAGLQDGAAVAELDLMQLEVCAAEPKHYDPLPRFPGMSRDLNFVMTEAVFWKDLEAVVRQSGGALLSDVTYSGQYRGKQIGAGNKSYVVTCRFQAEDRTLTAEEVDAAVQEIVAACSRELDAQLR